MFLARLDCYSDDRYFASTLCSSAFSSCFPINLLSWAVVFDLLWCSSFVSCLSILLVVVRCYHAASLNTGPCLLTPLPTRKFRTPTGSLYVLKRKRKRTSHLPIHSNQKPLILPQILPMFVLFLCNICH